MPMKQMQFRAHEESRLIGGYKGGGDAAATAARKKVRPSYSPGGFCALSAPARGSARERRPDLATRDAV